ncbi:MAG TPA: hypothetical protein VFL36_17280, partial [Myxococcales bacterium]|nr:hypothetical protein [Myxococcales bacterium]
MPAASQAAVALALAFGNGACAAYAQASRGPAPDFSQLPIDAMTPRESTQWSFFWGMKSSLWSPLDCVKNDARTGKCERARDPCDGNGVGRVEMSLPWYSVPLAVVTLGMAI